MRTASTIGGCLVALLGVALAVCGGGLAMTAGVNVFYPGMLFGVCLLATGLLVIVLGSGGAPRQKWTSGSVLGLLIFGLATWWGVGIVGNRGYVFALPAIPILVAMRAKVFSDRSKARADKV